MFVRTAPGAMALTVTVGPPAQSTAGAVTTTVLPASPAPSSVHRVREVARRDGRA